MKKLKRFLAIIISIVMIMCSTLPSLANGSEEVPETSESKIVEQLKEDLGEEKATEILKNSDVSVDEESETTAGDDIMSSIKEEPEEESESTVEDDILSSLEEEPEEETESTVEDEEEETSMGELHEPEENVGASTASPEEESELTVVKTEEETSMGELHELEEDATTVSEKESEENFASESPEETKEDVTDVEEIEEEKTSDDLIESEENKRKVNNIEIKNEFACYKEIATFSETKSFAIGSSSNYTLSGSLWYPSEGINGITKGLVTKIIIEQSDTIPSGTEFIVGHNDDNSDTLKAYLNGTEVTIHIPMGCILYAPENCYGLFSFFDSRGSSPSITRESSLVEISGLSLLNTENVTDMEHMFFCNNNLTILDVSSFDTSSVTSFRSMFQGCSLLTNIDVSNFITNNAKKMDHMFAGCSSLTTLNVSNFNTEHVGEDIVYPNDIFYYDCGFIAMFESCSSLTSIDVSNFNTSNAHSFLQMFHKCAMLESIDISNFDSSNVINMSSMFNGCVNLNELILGNLETINVTGTDTQEYNTGFAYMFGNCSSLSKLNLSSFDTNSVVSMSNMFRNCSNLKQIYVSTSFKTQNVQVSDHMFSGCTSLVGGNGTTFDSSHVDKEYARIDAEGTPGYFTIKNAPTPWMWWYVDGTTIHYSNSAPASGGYAVTGDTISYNGLTKSDITRAVFDNTINAQTTASMFESFTSLETIENINNLNTSNVTDMTCMFDSCEGLRDLDLSSFDTSNVTSLGAMFNFCTSLRSVDLSSFNTGNVTNMSEMFTCCSSLTSIDLSSFDTSSVVYINHMFYQCSSLTTIYVSNNFVTTNVTDSDDMFTDCTSLVGGNGTTFDSSHIDKEYARIDSTATPGYFTYREAPTPTPTLDSISIDTNPSKLTYNVGEKFNPNGLKIKLNYSDGTSDIVTYNDTTKNSFAFNPSLDTALDTTHTNVVVTYSSKTANIPITVEGGETPTLTSIAVSSSPRKTSYVEGNYLAPAGLVIKLTYSDSSTENVSYNNTTKNSFSFNPSLSTRLSTSMSSVTVTYGGKSASFKIKVSSGGYTPSGGGGSSGGSGGGTIASIQNQINAQNGLPSSAVPSTSRVAGVKSISQVVDTAASNWAVDPQTGRWKLNTIGMNGQVQQAVNGFYLLTNVVVQVVNGNPVSVQANNTYYFDASGNMVTGWVQTADSKWYFFENAKTAEEGKMSIGWKQVQGSWYYFTPEGDMMTSGMTPDGFVIGADGKWQG